MHSGFVCMQRMRQDWFGLAFSGPKLLQVVLLGRHSPALMSRITGKVFALSGLAYYGLSRLAFGSGHMFLHTLSPFHTQHPCSTAVWVSELFSQGRLTVGRICLRIFCRSPLFPIACTRSRGTTPAALNMSNTGWVAGHTGSAHTRSICICWVS